MAVAAFANNSDGTAVVTGRWWSVAAGGRACVSGDHRDAGVGDASDSVDAVMGLVTELLPLQM